MLNDVNNIYLKFSTDLISRQWAILISPFTEAEVKSKQSAVKLEAGFQTACFLLARENCQMLE